MSKQYITKPSRVSVYINLNEFKVVQDQIMEKVLSFVAHSLLHKGGNRMVAIVKESGKKLYQKGTGFGLID